MRGPLYAPWFCLKSMKPRPRLCSPFRAHVSGFLSGHFKSGQWKTVLEREEQESRSGKERRYRLLFIEKPNEKQQMPLIEGNLRLQRFAELASQAERIDVAVAWARPCEAKEALAASGADIRIVVGISNNLTDPTTLRSLNTFAKATHCTR